MSIDQPVELSDKEAFEREYATVMGWESRSMIAKRSSKFNRSYMDVTIEVAWRWYCSGVKASSSPKQEPEQPAGGVVDAMQEAKAALLGVQVILGCMENIQAAIDKLNSALQHTKTPVMGNEPCGLKDAVEQQTSPANQHEFTTSVSYAEPVEGSPYTHNPGELLTRIKAANAHIIEMAGHDLMHGGYANTPEERLAYYNTLAGRPNPPMHHWREILDIANYFRGNAIAMSPKRESREYLSQKRMAMDALNRALLWIHKDHPDRGAVLVAMASLTELTEII